MSGSEVSSRELERNLIVIGWMQALLHTMALTIPALTFLWLKEGLTVGEVFILQALYALAVAAFEVPSGYLADVLGRKAALVVALIGAIAGALAYCFASDFSTFLLGELLWAVALSFASGADYALYVDSLRALGRELEAKRLWGRVRSNSFLVSAVCMVLGGLLATWNLRAPLVIQCGFMVGTLFLVFMIREPKRGNVKVQAGGAGRELLQILRQALVHDARLRWLLLFPAVLLCMTRLGVWLYQPYFALSGVSVAYFGLIWAGFDLAAAVGSRSAHRIDAAVTERMFALGAVLAVGTAYLGLGAQAALLIGLLFLVQQAIRGVAPVLFGDRLNQMVGSERRATFLSLQSMMGSVLYAAVVMPLGIFTDHFGVLPTLLLNGVLTFTLGIVAFLTLAGKGAHPPR